MGYQQGKATKEELISAINSFVNARLSVDGNLIQFSAALLNDVIATLDFAVEKSDENTQSDDQPEENLEEIVEETPTTEDLLP